MEDRERIVEQAAAYAEEILRAEPTGHGADHTMRVTRLACRIAEGEKADLAKVQLLALLHDVDDRKLFPETAGSKAHAVQFLTAAGFPEAEIREFCTLIEQIRFRGTDSVVPDTVEGRCVQDADRLDAIGAIGIARAFTYGGAKGRPLYDPAVPPQPDLSGEAYDARVSTTLNHFYEKLLLLKDRMTTETGREIARHRHDYLAGFVGEFLDEWEGKR